MVNIYDIEMKMFFQSSFAPMTEQPTNDETLISGTGKSTKKKDDEERKTGESHPFAEVR